MKSKSKKRPNVTITFDFDNYEKLTSSKDVAFSEAVNFILRDFFTRNPNATFRSKKVTMVENLNEEVQSEEPVKTLNVSNKAQEKVMYNKNVKHNPSDDQNEESVNYFK